jgi:WD40 repeat protein
MGRVGHNGGLVRAHEVGREDPPMTSTPFDRLDALFDQARRLDGQAREAYLDEACGGDQALRAELSSLLEHHEARGASLDDPGTRATLRRLVDRVLDEPAPAGAPFRPPPFEIPGFRLQGLLGEGGMGRVYEARQERPLRVVALKVLKPSLLASDSRQVRQRFEREQEALARLRHPGIAPIFEAGLVETELGPLPWYAMERVHGLPLLEHAERHGLDLAARLELVARIADAVQHAHEQGVVHRDLKPSNLLVDESGSPRVLDFGVARLVDADAQLTTLHTGAGQLIGTLSYMSPEQASGDPAAIDARTDVYSLGLITYELVSGERPHDFGDRPLPEVLRLLREEPTTLLGSIDRDLRGDVETIVARALEPDRERRYPSAGALADDIRRHLRHEPIVARPPTTLYQLGKFARRNKLLVGGVAVALVGLTLGLVAALRFGLREAAALEESQWQSYLASVGAAASGIALDDHATARERLERCPPELRGWEWHHLALASDRSLGRVNAHEERLTGVALDPSGARLVSSAWDGSFAVWSTDTWERLDSGRALFEDGHRCRLYGADVLADGVLLAGRGPEVMLWRAGAFARFAPDSEVRELNGFLDVAAAPDGTWFATCSNDPTVRVRSADGAIVARLVGHRQPVVGLAVHPDGRRLATASNDGTVRLWEAVEARLLATFPASDPQVAVAFDPTGERLAAGSLAGGITLWKVESRRRLATAAKHAGAVGQLAFSLDGTRLYSGGDDRTLRTWQVTDAGLTPLAVQHGHVGAVAALTVLPDGRVVTGDRAGDLRVWPAEMHDDAGLPAHEGAITGLAFSPDGRRLVSSSTTDRSVRLWDPIGGELLATLPVVADDLAVTTSAFVTASQWASPAVRLWDLERGEALREFSIKAHCLAVGRDGQTLLAGAFAGPLQGIDLVTGQVRELDFPPCGWALTLGADGRKAFAGGQHWNGDLLVHDLVDGGTKPLEGHSDSIQSMALTADGERLVTASLDGTLRLWDTRERRCLAVLRGHEKGVQAVALLPDDSRIVSGSDDGTVRLWDLASGVPVATLRGHASGVRALAVSPGGDVIVSGDLDGRLRFWDTNPAAVRAREAGQRVVERAAAHLAALDEEPLHPRELEKHLRADAALDPAVRRCALLRVAVRSDPERTWRDRLWVIASDPGRPREAYEDALALCDALARNTTVKPSDLHSRGVVLLRLERFAEALETFARARAALPPENRAKLEPDYLVWEALCHHGLGRDERARELLDALRPLPAGRAASLEAFVAEAEAAIGDGS